MLATSVLATIISECRAQFTSFSVYIQKCFLVKRFLISYSKQKSLKNLMSIINVFILDIRMIYLHVIIY